VNEFETVYDRLVDKVVSTDLLKRFVEEGLRSKRGFAKRTLEK